MKFKFALLAFLFVGLSYTVVAQTSEEEVDAVATLFGVKKKQAIAELVNITPTDSAKFWKVYNAYEAETKVLRKQRIALYEETANSYSTMDSKKADSLALKFFSNRDGQEKLMEKYYAKMKAETNPLLAFQFYQSETYILTQVRASIMQQIPTYGQMSKLFKK